MAREPIPSTWPPPVKIHHVAFAHAPTAAPHDRFAELLGVPVCHEV